MSDPWAIPPQGLLDNIKAYNLSISSVLISFNAQTISVNIKSDGSPSDYFVHPFCCIFVTMIVVELDHFTSHKQIHGAREAPVVQCKGKIALVVLLFGSELWLESGTSSIVE